MRLGLCLFLGTVVGLVVEEGFLCCLGGASSVASPVADPAAEVAMMAWASRRYPGGCVLQSLCSSCSGRGWALWLVAAVLLMAAAVVSL